MIEKKFYGERLRSARMYRGLTLTELAKRTEISKQSISLYENDNNTPDYMKVRLLASELNFPYDYFFQKDSYAAKTETTYFRSLASATKKDRTAQSIKLEYVAKMYEILLEFISFPEMNLPSVDFVGCDDVFECENEDAIQVKCPKCGYKKILLDCEEIWQNAMPRLRKCHDCKTKEYNIRVGFIRRENGSVKWVYIGNRCTNCGLLGSYLDWKISYEPTDKMEINI